MLYKHAFIFWIKPTIAFGYVTDKRAVSQHEVGRPHVMTCIANGAIPAAALLLCYCCCCCCCCWDPTCWKVFRHGKYSVGKKKNSQKFNVAF